MSEEMAVSDNASGEEAKVNEDEATGASGEDAEEVSAAAPEEPVAPESELAPEVEAVKAEPSDPPEPDLEPKPEPVEEPEPRVVEDENDGLPEPERGIKRRASALSDSGESFRGFVDEIKPDKEDDFKGFDSSLVEEKDVPTDYSTVIERLEAEVREAETSYTPVRTISAFVTVRASKRLRQDTDGSRPSSGLSSRSDGDGWSNEGMGSPGTAGASARGRRPPPEMGSPALRVPLERGWRRELVFRAALDQHQRRNADVYYYTPKGKKLRSTREVAEHLSGTGLTLDNFSFFKESLGIDDPEKEIIRDAKLMRRVESPVSAPKPALEGKRTPKPKPPKGASPERDHPQPPAKIKVKSMGSRLSGSGPPAASKAKKPTAAAPAAATDNNNSAAWKKPRQPPPALPGPPVASAPPSPDTAAPDTPVPVTAPLTSTPLTSTPLTSTPLTSTPVTSTPMTSSPATPPPPPPLQSRPQQQQTSPDVKTVRSAVQPCSLTCGRGVPSLSCAACLCLYHRACAGYSRRRPPPDTFYCKNCRKSTSPTREPPPLTHKSGVPVPQPALPAPVARRPTLLPVPVPVPLPVPVPVPVPVKKQQDKRVLLRMKVAGGGPDGERVWAVAKPQQAIPKPQQAIPKPQPVPKGQIPPVSKVQPPVPRAAPPPAPAPPRPALPQSLAVINGRRFIIVTRNMVQPSQPHEDKRTRGRISNGVSSEEVSPPRRRGRASAKPDIDHFTEFYKKAKEHNYNVVTQIFQYVGMRELAMCARVCRLWRELAATPALWRHVRMKNSHVSDWAGLCAALKRHGTARLDLRKMLLPHNDAAFWQHFAAHIPTVDTLERIEMCRCPASAVEAVCRGLPALRSLSALAIRDALLDPGPLAELPRLTELRLKSMNGLSLTRDLKPLASLINLQHLSLTSIKELGWCASEVLGSLEQLETLELGECSFRAEFAGVLRRLRRLRRLRLERGTAPAAAPSLLRALATLPDLTRLELVNIDVKVGFDEALAECKNIQRLLIIPTYVSQSATTNKQVLSGVLRLKDTLTHLMWGVTIELLRVTELFIDQCEQAGDKQPRDLGECIPVLKPVPGCRLPEHTHGQGPPQVEILPLPTLQRLLSAQLPNTKLKLLRIPFHATWRQSLADFQ